VKQKRIIERPWGRRRNGGWVIRLQQLIGSLKKGEAVQLDKITVGTKQLVQLLKTLPGEYCQVSANGRLEVETVEFKSRKGKDGQRRPGYVRPKRYHNWFGLNDGAWLKPAMSLSLVVLKPRKF
jgi:hypothetical protein